jgi:stage IV sporulation protein A
MTDTNLYHDIATRTGGDIYIGVVGPVRTGKSTLIKRFMDSMVIPNIENIYMKERARDELPQSGSGRTIMTAEPKFVPEEAVEIQLDGAGKVKVRLIDCVGYMVNGALGQMENEAPRMVSTPWFDYEIPMAEAAEIGTRKVIAEHSTIGLVVTTDGSVTEIDRADYLPAEERVIEELKALGKPFLVLVNSQEPDGAAARAVCDEITQKYGVSCQSVNCLTLSEGDIREILKSVLYEFPMKELGVRLPAWANGLDCAHPVKTGIFQHLRENAAEIAHMRDLFTKVGKLTDYEQISSARIGSVDLGNGCAVVEIEMPRSIYYDIIREESGVEIADEAEIIPLLRTLSEAKREYDRIMPALEQARAAGYGIVMPTQEELTLEQPEIVRQGGHFGVRLRASAPSIHLIRADIKTEVSPVVGSERQSEDLVQYLLHEFDDDTAKIWDSNIFGKSLHDLITEGLNAKLNHMPEDARGKLQETLQRIINEGSGGLICIIL